MRKERQNQYLNVGFTGSKIGLFVLLFFAAILIFNDLSKPGLPSNDDCAKTMRAWEMIQNGDILTPHLGGEPDFDHPPLYIGMIALSIMIFGKTAFAARFFGALCGLLIIWITYETGREVRDRRTGWWAGFFLATTFLFVKIIRSVQADVPFMLLASTALFFFIKALNESERQDVDKRKMFTYFLLFGFLAGLTGLVKSVFMIFPLSAPFIFLIIKRKLNKKIILPCFFSIFIALLTSGWWFLYSVIRHGDLFISKFFSKFLGHHISGGSGMGKFRAGGYIYEFLRHFWPWLPLLIFAVWLIFRNKKLRENVLIQLLAVHALLPLFVLSFAGDKAARYILFTYAPLVIITAAGLLHKAKEKTEFRYMRAAVVFLALVCAFVIIRPMNLDNIPNEDYIILGDKIANDEFRPKPKLDWYHFGNDYKGNMRGLLYYTGIKLNGILPSAASVGEQLKERKRYYLLVDNDDISKFDRGKFRIIVKLKTRSLFITKTGRSKRLPNR